MKTQKITPFLWYTTPVEDAAACCVGVFPDSRHAGHGHARRFPSGPPGAVKIVEFELFGQPFIAMNAGPLEPFNHAVLFVVNCGGWADSTLTATPCWPAVRRKPAAG